MKGIPRRPRQEAEGKNNPETLAHQKLQGSKDYSSTQERFCKVSQNFYLSLTYGGP